MRRGHTVIVRTASRDLSEISLRQYEEEEGECRRTSQAIDLMLSDLKISEMMRTLLLYLCNCILIWESFVMNDVLPGINFMGEIEGKKLTVRNRRYGMMIWEIWTVMDHHGMICHMPS